MEMELSIARAQFAAQLASKKPRLEDDWLENSKQRHGSIARASSVPSRSSMSTVASASALSSDTGYVGGSCLSSGFAGDRYRSSEAWGSRDIDVRADHSHLHESSYFGDKARKHQQMPNNTEHLDRLATDQYSTAPPCDSFARGGDCTEEFVELLTGSPSPTLRRINAFRRVVLEPKALRASPVKGVPSLAAVATAARVAADNPSVAAREDATAVVENANWIVTPLASGRCQQVTERWQRALGAAAAVGGAAVAATVNAARRDQSVINS
jgi:hypothetical protein